MKRGYGIFFTTFIFCLSIFPILAEKDVVEAQTLNAQHTPVKSNRSKEEIVEIPVQESIENNVDAHLTEKCLKRERWEKRMQERERRRAERKAKKEAEELVLKNEQEVLKNEKLKLEKNNHKKYKKKSQKKKIEK